MSFKDPTQQYRYSFSGADARAFVYFPGLSEEIAQLEALHTISVSVHEAKGQARALGHRGIKGLSRGVRTTAGSLILTVIEDNPLRPLMEALFAKNFLEGTDINPMTGINPSNLLYGNVLGWSIDQRTIGIGTALDRFDFANRIAPLIPPFNMIIHYISEGSKWGEENGNSRITDVPGVSLLLKGIEFIDEGIVTSVNDIVTEVTMSFIAHDLKPISKQTFEAFNKRVISVEDAIDSAEAELRKILNSSSQQIIFEDTREIPLAIPYGNQLPTRNIK